MKIKKKYLARIPNSQIAFPFYAHFLVGLTSKSGNDLLNFWSLSLKNFEDDDEEKEKENILVFLFVSRHIEIQFI